MTTVRDGGLERAQAAQQIVEWTRDADSVVVGAGSGLSAAAGLDFGDRGRLRGALSFTRGARPESGIRNDRLPRSLRRRPSGDSGPCMSKQMRFADGRSPVYENLRRVVGDKHSLVLTSNVDAMFARNGFERERHLDDPGGLRADAVSKSLLAGGVAERTGGANEHWKSLTPARLRRCRTPTAFHVAYTAAAKCF